MPDAEYLVRLLFKQTLFIMKMEIWQLEDLTVSFFSQRCLLALSCLKCVFQLWGGNKQQVEKMKIVSYDIELDCVLCVALWTTLYYFDSDINIYLPQSWEMIPVQIILNCNNRQRERELKQWFHYWWPTATLAPQNNGTLANIVNLNSPSF